VLVVLGGPSGVVVLDEVVLLASEEVVLLVVVEAVVGLVVLVVVEEVLLVVGEVVLVVDEVVVLSAIGNSNRLCPRMEAYARADAACTTPRTSRGAPGSPSSALVQVVEPSPLRKTAESVLAMMTGGSEGTTDNATTAPRMLLSSLVGVHESPPSVEVSTSLDADAATRSFPSAPLETGALRNAPGSNFQCRPESSLRYSEPPNVTAYRRALSGVPTEKSDTYDGLIVLQLEPPLTLLAIPLGPQA